MKRYAFDATRGEMFEIASGAWVSVDDARAAVERLMVDAAETEEAVKLARALIAGYQTQATSLAAANALLVDAIPANVSKAPWLIRRDEHFAACGFNPVTAAHLAEQPAPAPSHCPVCGPGRSPVGSCYQLGHLARRGPAP